MQTFPSQRPVSRLVALVSVWMLIMAAVAPAQAAASVSEEAAFIAEVNATRASVGQPALLPDVQLTSLARTWASAMRNGTCGEGDFICHASPISAGVTHSWAKLGENVGTGPDVSAIMNAFIASQGHYANIVDAEFTHIGVGVVWDGNRMFTAHRFMKLQSSTPTTTVSRPAASPPAFATAASPPAASPPAFATPPPTTRAVAAPTVPASGERASDGAPTPQPEAVLERRASAIMSWLMTMSSLSSSRAARTASEQHPE